MSKALSSAEKGAHLWLGAVLTVIFSVEVLVLERNAERAREAF